MDQGEELESGLSHVDAEAQYSLGCRYLFGEGVAANAERAVHWFRRSAQHGCTDAQRALGQCYLDGVGVEKDPVMAVAWLERAAAQGHALAQHYLGWCYWHGCGVAADPVRSIEWALLAAEQGRSDAQLVVGNAYRTGRGVPKNLRWALYWLQRAQAQEPRARRLVRIVRWKLHPVLRYLHRTMWIAGLALLAHHAATVPFSIRWQAVLMFVGIVYVVAAVLVVVSSLLGSKAPDNEVAEHGLPLRRPRNWLGLVLQIASEDGLFLVPLLHIGITLPFAIIAGAAFGLAHYPWYSLPACIPKGVSYVLVALFVLPSGIWSVLAGHLIVDVISFGVQDLYKRKARAA